MGASASKHKLHGSKRDVHRIPDRPSPPGKPQLVPGTPHSEPDVVTIRWDPPEYDGGAKVTGYLVEHRRTGSPHWVRASPSLVRVPELTLSGLEPGWRYQFRVSARNSIGMSEPGELSELLTVTLQRTAASAPHFVRELTDIVALENDKAELTVEIRGTPTPTIAWYKDGLEIFSGRRHRIITENGTSTLVIHQTALSDEGEIKCTATNRVGHAVTKATLRMEAPPSIRLPRQYEEGLLFEKDEVMRLKVTIAGRPEPSISWLHNGEPLPNSGRYEMTFNDKFAALRVDEARRSDRGEYQVRAINNLGEDIASFLVTVTDRPQSPGKAKVVMTLGRSVTLSWVAPEDDGGCKIGNYIVEYYRLGWNMWLKAATCRQLTTTLGDLIEGSEYKFRVKAENPYGVSDPGEESDILFIPDPNRGLLTAPDRREGGMSMEDVGVEEWLLEPNKRPRETTPGGSPSREHKKVKKKPERGKTPERQLTPEITLTNEDNELFPRQKLIPDFKEQQDAPKVPKRRAKRKQLDLKGYDEEDDEIFKQKVKIIDEGKVEVKKERRAKSEEFHGSSELMLVLLPHSRATTEERESDRKEVFDSLKDGSPGIAPPMSLSAPELGSIEPERTMQRLWVSSTELLHEKAMARFYQAVAEEEAEKALTRRYSFERRSSSRTRDIPQFVRNKSITRSDENIQDKTTKLSLQFEEKPKDRIIIDEKKREKKLSDENLTKTQMRNRKGLLYAQRSSEESYDEEMEDDEYMESEMEEEESMEETEEEEAEYELEEEEEEYDEEMEEEEDEIDDMDLLGESESEFDDRSRHSIEEETYHPRSMVPKSTTTYSPAITSPSFTSKPKKNIAENLKPVTDVATAVVSHSIKIPVKSTLKPPELPRPMVRIEVTPPPGEDRIKQEPKKHIIKPIIKKSLSPNREDISPRTSPNRPYSPPKLTPDGRHLPPTNPPTPKPILKIRDHSQERILQDDKKTNNNDNNKNNSKINSAPLAIVEPELNLMTSNEKLEVKNLEDNSNVTDSVKLKKKQVRIEEPESRKSYDLDENDMGITIAGDIARNRRRSSRTNSLIDSSDPSKCLIHHYGDIIREFGQIRKAPRTLYLNYEDLKAAALKSEENLNVDIKLNDEISKQNTQDEIENKSNDKTVGVVKINDETKIVTKDSRKYYGDEDHQNEMDNEENLEIEVEEEEEDKKEYKFLTETKEFKKLPQLVLLSEVKTNDDDDDNTFQKDQQNKEIIQQLQKYEENIEKYEYEDEEEQINNEDIHENKLTKVAEQKVRSVVDYLTDVAMFFIACWLYLFHDERLAIPVLILMVYRQAKEATVAYVRRQIARIPKFPRFSLPWRKKKDD